jgi:undecaprenyl-diphosphatase
MPIYQVLVLAVLQGFTEFLPISSSAHLALAPWLFGWKDQGLTFDIALHLGTLAAVLLYFFRDWIQILARGFGLRHGSDPDLADNPTLLWTIAAATVPVAIVGLLLKDAVETTLRSPYVMGTMLILVGVLIGIADKYGRPQRSLRTVTLFDAMFIGAAQAIAIIPGTSRSGITIAAGLTRHLERSTSARFSFLLSTPAIAAAAAKAMLDLRKLGGIEPGMQLPFILGILVSAVTGCVVIAFFLRFLRSYTLKIFVYYRIIFGIIVFALAIFRGYAE